MLFWTQWTEHTLQGIFLCLLLMLLGVPAVITVSAENIIDLSAVRVFFILALPYWPVLILLQKVYIQTMLSATAGVTSQGCCGRVFIRDFIQWSYYLTTYAYANT